MGSLVRQQQHPLAPLPRLLDIAQQPEVKSAKGKAGQTGIYSVLRGQWAVLLQAIPGSNLLEMRPSGNQLAHKKAAAHA